MSASDDDIEKYLESIPRMSDKEVERRIALIESRIENDSLDTHLGQLKKLEIQLKTTSSLHKCRAHFVVRLQSLLSQVNSNSTQRSSEENSRKEVADTTSAMRGVHELNTSPSSDPRRLVTDLDIRQLALAESDRLKDTLKSKNDKESSDLGFERANVAFREMFKIKKGEFVEKQRIGMKIVLYDRLAKDGRERPASAPPLIFAFETSRDTTVSGSASPTASKDGLAPAFGSRGPDPDQGGTKCGCFG